MKIIVGSQSEVKLNAVRSALKNLKIDAEIIGVKASSDVAEQPFNSETLKGAENRAAHAKRLDNSGDYYIAIENGIMSDDVDGKDIYTDHAIVLVLTKDGSSSYLLSEGVEFPAESVEKARKRGFDKVTVGKIMQEDGIVEKHDDPHFSLAGKPRAEFLRETVEGLLSTIIQQSKTQEIAVKAKNNGKGVTLEFSGASDRQCTVMAYALSKDADLMLRFERQAGAIISFNRNSLTLPSGDAAATVLNLLSQRLGENGFFNEATAFLGGDSKFSLTGTRQAAMDIREIVQQQISHGK